jgi:hypothetical protein
MKKLQTIFCIAAALSTTCLLHAGNVVTDWNTIASMVIVKNGGKAPPTSAVWFTYSSIAVYDAVNAITGEYKTFYYHNPAPEDASVDAAAVAAAHRVLVNCFPAQKVDLDAWFADSVKAIQANQQAKDAGLATGEASALALIAARTGDGLEANVAYTPGSGPGAWVPTPPGFLAPLAPWLGQLRPFTLSPSAVEVLRGPALLASAQWKRDYDVTRLYGASGSTLRSPQETEVGLFWTEHTAQQYARVFNYLVDTYHLSTPESARLIAILWTGYADAEVACFQAKYKYGFWRPITAIQAGGGSPGFDGDPSWAPLGTTPNHPEYPSSHGSATSAIATLIAGYFGTTKVHIVTDSLAFADGTHKHTFEDTRDLIDEVMWARMYTGFHFYSSVRDASELGSTVARDLLRTHFGRRRD